MARRLRRSLKRARLRTWKAVRTYPMLLLTFVVLGLAAAGGLGAFDSSGHQARPSPRPLAVALEPTDPFVTPADLPRPPRLVMTYYLVSTPEMQQVLNTVKDALRFREWLEKSAFEVFLIQTPEDEERAQGMIKTAQSYPLSQFIVEDLRGR